jgi:GH24 family phage-related lysozyme (muramidase)
MKISKQGLELIKSFEGCRLKAYQDIGGVWTIGYGHTDNVKSGDIITQKEADELLLKDLERFEKHVSTYVPIYDFNQNQYDALVSFAFNVGNIRELTANGKNSISDIKKLLPQYCHVKGVKVNGLVRRRNAELKLFNTKTKKIKKYYAKCNKNETSIVEGLKDVGEKDTSFENRKKIATKNNIKNYSGTANQNIKMLNKLKKGTLLK